MFQCMAVSLIVPDSKPKCQILFALNDNKNIKQQWDHVKNDVMQ